MKRREFIAGATALTGCLLAPLSNGKTSSSQRRKSLIHLLPNAPELIAYKKAVGYMRNLPLSDPRNWLNQARIHFSFCPHKNWWFLPWHRVYIHYFEQLCRTLLQNGDFTLPYWDWTRYPYIPKPFLDPSSPLFIKGRGPIMQVPSEAVGWPRIETILKQPMISQIFSGKTLTDNQRDPSTEGDLEASPHDLVHSTVGGEMLTPFSPLDPVFWMHHCNLDRIWESWLVLHRYASPQDSLWGNHLLNKFFDPISNQPVTIQCSETLYPSRFGAQYDRLEVVSGYTLNAILPSVQILFGPGEAIKTPGALPVVISASSESARIDGQQTAFSLDITPEFRQLLDRNLNFNLSGPHYLFSQFALLLDNVPIPKTPTIAVRVFLNIPNARALTRFDGSNYIGIVSFFPVLDPKMKHTETSFSFDIGSNIAKLKTAGSQLKQLEVALVSVDLQNPTAAPEAVRPAKVRIVGLPPNSNLTRPDEE